MWKTCKQLYMNIVQYTHLKFFNQHKQVHISNNILECSHTMNVQMVSIATLSKIYSAGTHLEQNIASHTCRELFSQSCWIKLKFDCNFIFPAHLAQKKTVCSQIYRQSVIIFQIWFDLTKFEIEFPNFRTTFPWHIYNT